MEPTPRTATWQVTDTMAVPVEVLNLTDDGRAYIRSASGAKWVPTTELNMGARR